MALSRKYSQYNQLECVVVYVYGKKVGFSDFEKVNWSEREDESISPKNVNQ